MELDKRIIKGKRPLTCFDLEQGKDFVGKKGYFADYLNQYSNISDLTIDVLKAVSLDENECTPYKTNITSWEYFLPSEWGEEEKKEPEKKYRPYTIKDFEKAFLNDEFDDFIIFRDKHDHGNVYTMRYNGNFRKGEFEYICLGAKNFSFESLFENYEVANYDGDFVPFGVLEE